MWSWDLENFVVTNLFQMSFGAIFGKITEKWQDFEKFVATE